MCEVKGAPVDMMVFVLNADDNLVAFSEQRDAKGVSTVLLYWHFTKSLKLLARNILVL